MIVKGNLRGLYKETLVACDEAVFLNFIGRTEIRHKNPKSGYAVWDALITIVLRFSVHRISNLRHLVYKCQTPINNCGNFVLRNLV
jgi:hypothetical protein